MRKGNKFLTIVFSVAIIATYLLIGFVYLNIIRNDLFEMISETTSYSAHQITSIVKTRLQDDFNDLEDYFNNDEVKEITCDDLSCSVLRLFELKKVFNPLLDEISNVGVINIKENVLLIPSSLEVGVGSVSSYDLNYKEDVFNYNVHILTINHLLDSKSQQLYLDKGVILYLYQFNDDEYHFVTKPNTYFNELLTSLPLAGEKIIYIMGYDSRLDVSPIANINNGMVFYGEDEGKVTNLIDEIKTSNGNNVLDKFIGNLDNPKPLTLTINGSSQLVCVEPFFYNTYLVYTTSQTSLKSMISDLELTTYIVIAISILLMLILAGVIYFVVLKRLNDSYHSKSRNENSQTFIAEIGKNGKIKYANYMFKKSFKQYKDNIYDYEYIDHSFDEAINKGELFSIKETTREGRDIYIRFAILRKFKHYEIVGVNVTKDIKTLELMKNLAFVDQFTLLPNKQALQVDLNNVLNEDLDNLNSLLIFNILRFKEINTLFGYGFGDMVINEVGKYLIDEVKDCGKVYRVENDNFGILLTNIESYAYSVDLTKRILTLFSKPINLKGNEIKLQVKVGIFHLNKEQVSDLKTEKIIENAFMAAHYIKDSNRFDYYVYDRNLELALLKDEIMSKDIGQALLNREFDVFYQPQYSLKQKKIIGYEALLRWKNPKYASESPLKYIELAEKNGMINEIGKFVLEETFAFAEYLKDTGVHISINLSPVQLMQVGFLNEFIKMFDDHKLTKKSICIEITETYLINNFDEAISKLKILAEKGIHIHLDDFGSGYSSMQYLKNLPINAIKIDKEFTKAIEYDKYSRVIVTRLINLAKDLDLYVIVEGVETQGELNYLSKTNCDIIQGFLIGKAVPKQEAISLLTNFTMPKGTPTAKKR